MEFEIELEQRSPVEWVATAVAHGVSATGATEKEALARIMEALTAHFKKQAR